MPRTSVLGQVRLAVDDVGYAKVVIVVFTVPDIANIPAGAPQLRPDLGRPEPWLARPPLAHRKHDRAPGLAQGPNHGAVTLDGGLLILRREAIVVFQVIDAPGGERLRVLFFVAE